MSEALIRDSLDQALLALVASADGDQATASVHATLSASLATLSTVAGAALPTGASGRGSDLQQTYLLWRQDIDDLRAAQAQREVEARAAELDASTSSRRAEVLGRRSS